jgi:hypothetical protein
MWRLELVRLTPPLPPKSKKNVAAFLSACHSRVTSTQYSYI